MRDTTKSLANREQEDLKPTLEAEESEKDLKFAGGKAPPVGGGFHEQVGTAQLAYEEDANERELKIKVSSLVSHRFGGDYKKAFEHYDADKDGAVNKDELVALLYDASVGSLITRGIWASKIIDKLDRNDDKAIQWSEFESVFKVRA